ncbi:MAG: FAD-dependent oxidoreductase [Acidimicrobiales bacterium]
MTLMPETIDPETIDTARPCRVPHVTVLADRCAGCQECVVRCPTGALTMDSLSWTAAAEDKLCVGCRQCVRTCPFGAIEVDGPLLVSARVELPHHPATELPGNLDETRPGISTWAEALAETQRCLSCPDPTCVRGCPVHNDIPGFIAAVRNGDLDEAHQVLRRTTFLPDICSRVCDQAVQCEGSCTWSLAGGTAVAIGAIERFITDNASIPPLEQTDAQGSDLKVAVVGSGPAGIGAAFELTRSGAQVTVFEKDARPGGLLRWGIPDFTLPRRVAERPWEALASSGVTLHCGVEVSPERIEALRQSYDAVVLAHGAGQPLRLQVEGGDLDGVCDATQFLGEARAALAEARPCSWLAPTLVRPENETPTVLVLGAGNTAMDVARLARRLGARAICIDWMDRRFAPVRPDELDEAQEEGVDIRFSSTLQRLEGIGGHVALAYLSQTRQVSAAKPPKIVSGQVAKEMVDLVVMAMGYRIDPAFGAVAPTTPIARRHIGVPDRRWQASGLLAGGAPPFARHQPVGELALGREIGRVSAALGTAERVWVAGDALVGPSTVVEAMAQGRRAARAILDGQPSARSGSQPGKVATALVVFESRSGHTERLAMQIAGELARKGAEVRTRRLAGVGLAELATVDLVVLGTWVEGFVVAGVGPARATRAWLDRLPGLGATKFATFCSYGIAPKDTLAHLRRTIEAKGGQVVAESAFGPRDRLGGAPERFALAALSGVLGEPGTGDVVAEAVAAGE